MLKQPARRSSRVMGYVCFFITLFVLTGCDDTSAPSGRRISNVTVVDVTHITVTPSKDYVVRTKAVSRVGLRSRVQGYLTEKLFTEGSFVKKGQLLFKIDSTQFRIALNKAQANLDIDKTKALESERSLKRGKGLIAQKLISQETYDGLISTAQQDNAAVEASMAELAQAKLDLSYTNITAPFDGMIGLSNYNLGSLVSSSDEKPLATITSIDPIYAAFAVDEPDFLNYFSIHKDSEALKNRLNFQLTLADNSPYAEQGKLNFIDPEVNEETDTITLRASFPNPQQKLRPGMYATIRVSDTKNKVFPAIPQIAIQQGKNGAFVYVVKNDKAVKKNIKPGPVEGMLQAVTDGIDAQDKVIVQGFLNVRNGRRVHMVEATIDSKGNIKLKVPPVQNESSNTTHKAKHKIKL